MARRPARVSQAARRLADCKRKLYEGGNQKREGVLLHLFPLAPPQGSQAPPPRVLPTHGGARGGLGPPGSTFPLAHWEGMCERKKR